jgi:hypothetical protein
MSVITIQCRLVAEEDTLRQLWELMAEKNTPLINELLVQVGKHPKFEAWLEEGKISTEFLKTLVNSLKTQEHFAGQPGRFYTSAIALVNYVYKSWFALQKRRKRQIEGKERWLTILKSDLQLEQESQCSLNVIRTKAITIPARGGLKEMLFHLAQNFSSVSTTIPARGGLKDFARRNS